MMRNHFRVVFILLHYGWKLPLNLFHEICELGHLKIIRLLYQFQRQDFTRKHVIEGIRFAAGSKAFEVIRFLLKRFSEGLDGIITEAFDYAVQKVSKVNESDYMDLVRILLYDGRAKPTARHFEWALAGKKNDLLKLMEASMEAYKRLAFPLLLIKPDFEDPSLSIPYITFESGARWTVFKGDNDLALQFMSRRSRRAVAGKPSKTAWLHLMDNMAQLANKAQMKQILRLIVESISLNCTRGEEEGKLPLHDERLLQTVHQRLFQLSQRFLQRDFISLSLLLHRYSLHVLAMCCLRRHRLDLYDDVSENILEEALLF
jgi:hypothetical protein